MVNYTLLYWAIFDYIILYYSMYFLVHILLSYGFCIEQYHISHPPIQARYVYTFVHTWYSVLYSLVYIVYIQTKTDIDVYI